MSPPTNSKLTSAEEILNYLSSTPFRSTSAEPLTGGSANFLFRLVLVNPYDHTPDSSPSSQKVHHTAVLKHAESYAASMPSLNLPLSRFPYEHRALSAVFQAPFMLSSTLDHRDSSLLDDRQPIVRVPDILHYDPDSNIVILEDIGEDAQTLKSFVLSEHSHPTMSPADLSHLCAEIGTHLGRFLANLHAWGQSSDEGRLMRQEFEGNTAARELCAWRIPQRLVQCVERFHVLDNDDDEKKVLQDVATFLEQDHLTSSETLTMGDFWTGNVLVKLKHPSNVGSDSRLESLHIVDWELAKPGSRVSDIGQFSAEAYLLARFTSPPLFASGHVKPNAGHALLRSFLDSYTSSYASTSDIRSTNIVQGTEGSLSDEVEVALHQAAHCAVFGPVTGWTTDENAQKKLVDDSITSLRGAWERKQGRSRIGLEGGIRTGSWVLVLGMTG